MSLSACCSNQGRPVQSLSPGFERLFAPFTRFDVVQALHVQKPASGSSCSELISCFSCRVFELAKQQGLKPNRDIGFCVLRACLDCKRADMAYAYALEFQANGLRVSPAQRVLIEGEAGLNAQALLVPYFPLRLCLQSGLSKSSKN